MLAKYSIVTMETTPSSGKLIHWLEKQQKKVFLLMAGPLRKKSTFLGTYFSNVPTFQRPLSSRGGGGLGLNGPAIKRITFFAASLKRFGTI